MLNLDTISVILDVFGGGAVSVQAEHCLNTRHKDAGCRLCVDACPTEAIELRPICPHLDADRCVSCGLCLHCCPTDVFTQRGAPETILAETVSLLSDNALALVCPQHDDPATTAAPVSAIVQHKRCLASLSAPRLMELSDGGRRTIWLDDSPCAACPIGRAQPAIARTATVTNRLLQAFDRRPAIRTHCSNPDTRHDEAVPRPVIDGDQPELSRRGFFSALRQLTRRTAATVIAEMQPTPRSSGPVPVDQRLPHRIPPSRGRLFRQLTRLGTPADEPVETADIPFAAVVVDRDACSACGLCARFCPTGALSLAADDETFVLYFRAAVCIDCGICALACPEDAVSFGSQVAGVALIEGNPQPLVAGNLAACVGCGVPTAVRGGEAGQPEGGPRCYVCRRVTSPAGRLKGTANPFANLMNRLPVADVSTENEPESGRGLHE